MTNYLLIELLANAFGPLPVQSVGFGGRVDVRELDEHQGHQHTVRLVAQVHVRGTLVELHDDVEVLFEVRGQNVLQHQITVKTQG